MSTPRGIRLNNPGNIRKGTIQWDGMSAEQFDPDFITFDDPVYGIRAIAKILHTYQTVYSTLTIADAISRWAPSNENDTQSYINDVCKRCNQQPTDNFIYSAIVPAIIWHENGQMPYTGQQITKALVLAGVQ